MKKKIISISLLTILVITISFSMTSCFEHHLRPSGVYSTYEYKDEAKGKTYRVLVNFIQENLDDKREYQATFNMLSKKRKKMEHGKLLKLRKVKV